MNGSRGDRHLGYSSRHTQVPVPATIQSFLTPCVCLLSKNFVAFRWLILK